MAEEQGKDGSEEQKPSLIKKLVLPLVLSIVVAAGAIGALKFMGIISIGQPEQTADAESAEGDEATDGEEQATDMPAGSPAFFFTLYPDFLVNLNANGNAHYLKLSIDVMSRDEEVIAGVEQYRSIIRNNLLKLFQEVDYEIVKSNEGVESLQVIASEEIRRVLKKYHGKNGVEGVYFTSFVVQ